MRIVYAALVALAAAAPQFIVRVPVAVAGVALSCADVTTRCVPSEYATIAAASAAATPGDDSVIWVSAGTYNVTVSPASGTSGHPLTLLASGTVTVCGMSFASKSYVRTIGFTFDPTGGGCSANPVVNGTGTNVGLEFWDDTIASNVNGNGYNFDTTAGSPGRCNQCIWLGGSVNTIGNGSGGTTTAFGMKPHGDDSFVGYVNLTAVCYIGLEPSGSRSRFVNLNFSGFIECGGGHPDFFFPNGLGTAIGWTGNLVESVFGIGTTIDPNNKFAHNSDQQGLVAWNDNNWRLNVAYDMGSSFYSVFNNNVGTQNRLHFYNNTMVDCAMAVAQLTSNSCGSIDLHDGGGGSVYIYNSLHYEAWGASVTSNIAPWAENAGTATIAKDYNLAFDPEGAVSFQSSWTVQAHPQTNVDPKLTNVAGQDFTLLSASPARGAGGPLTTATSCSGTTLNVATNTGSFFVGSNAANLTQYGGLLVPGDTLTVGASTTRGVVSVSGDAITVDASLTCANGDAVYFGSSSTIDIGAYPYKAGGYTLSATKAQVRSTVTITPNDASLARFAVVYENGIPKCIAAASNAWACTVGTGVITAYIYPRYASQTQRVTVP